MECLTALVIDEDAALTSEVDRDSNFGSREFEVCHRVLFFANYSS